MRRSSCLAVMVLVSSSAGAATRCVDGRNLTGAADGSAARPFPTIQAGVAAAAAGDTVAVAVGHYRETVHVHGKGLALLGGYTGAASYDGSAVGDFATRTADPSATWIEGMRTAPVVRLTDAPASRLDGFRVTAGQRGVLVDDEAWPSIVADVVISHNLVEANGVPTEHGGGIHALGQRLRILGNTVRANVGANGAGLYLHHCSDVLVDGNTVESNVGHNDHGGGLVLNGSGTISRNVFRANRIGETAGYGWGGGVLVVEAHATPALLRGNLFTGNYAPGAGGAVFVDEGATAVLDHELIVSNRCRGEGGGVYVDASWDGRRSRATLVSCTIADNVADVWPGIGAGIYVQGSDVVLRDSIVWSNTGLGGPDDFAVVDGGTLAATYTLSQEGLPGLGNLNADPLFADPGRGDYHLRSRAGRWSPALEAWTYDSQSSPAIDAGDPTSPYALEPEPNGRRVNLGFEGNSAEASSTVSALSGRVRRRLQQSCGSPLPMPAWPTSGYLLEMEAVGQVFRVWVTSAAGVQHLQRWLAAGPTAETLGIPGGPIELDGTFNPGYRYRMRPGEVSFGENWIELCDGTPCYVQEHAADWVENPSTWCPWSARVRAVWSCAGTGQSCGAPVFSAVGTNAPGMLAGADPDPPYRYLIGTIGTWYHTPHTLDRYQVCVRLRSAPESPPPGFAWCTPGTQRYWYPTALESPGRGGYTLGMKTAISVPDSIFREAERFARESRKSRSQLFSEAVAEYLARHTPDAVTEAMNRVCQRLDATDDQLVELAAQETLRRSEW